VSASPRARAWEAGLALAEAWLKLGLMAATLRLHPRLRGELAAPAPGYRARLQLVLGDGRRGVHAIFSGGRMRVGLGPLAGADTTLRFRAPVDLRAFFGPRGDALSLMLENRLAVEGNLSHLLRFGHLAAAARQGGRVLPPAPDAGDPRARRPWQEFPVRRVGEPCRARPAAEVRALEDPYLADLSLAELPRVHRLLWAARTTPPAVCVERARLWTEASARERAERPGEPAGLRQARVLAHVLTHKRAIVHADDLLAGTTTAQRLGVQIFPETGGLGIWPELLGVQARALNPYRLSAEDAAVLSRQVFPFWMDDNIREWARRQNGDPLALRLDERFVLYFLWKTQAVSHTIIDLPAALSRGLVDLQAELAARAEADPGRRDFHRGLSLALDGVLDYARRLSAEAAARAATSADPDERARCQAMAEACARVPARPARTLREALQAAWILLVCQHQENMNAGLSIGRLDVWLEPYLRRDLEGASDPAERQRRVRAALELVCAFLLKCTDHLPLVPEAGNRLFGGSSSDQVITLGGLLPDGGDAVCDATWLFLKATELLGLRDPNINARYAPGVNSEAYLQRLCEVNLITGATPSMHNDAAVVPALVGQGFRLEHARDWSATGCVEPTCCGRHFGHTNCMMFNLVAPLEMALHQGRHPLLAEQVGPRTPAPQALPDFAAFLEAYRTQLGWLIDRAVEANNLLGRAHQACKPSPLLSALFLGPRESGRDVIDGGAEYNSSGTAMIGLTDVVDSLCAIRVLVYERRELGFPELLAALAADFVGHERVLARLLTGAPKFGQTQPLPGELAAALMAFVQERFRAQPHYRGGRYLPGYWSMSNHVAFGLLSGALPSGRRRGKPFTPGLTPSQLAGAGLTEQIRAVAGLPSGCMPNNLAFNVKVAPGAQDPHARVVERLAAYTGAYFELGGMQMQLNVMSSAALREALLDPDSHRDLIVRISGYNAYFVDLNRDCQLELIERAEHALGGR